MLVLLALALATRLWDLGGRALHYDEILHAWYSWRYAENFDYAHNPLTHGPLLYHIGAATYRLIGSGEFAARLVPALFGAALVVMPWLFRKELGRYGALAVSLFLLVSPTVLYFGRFMRNDIYMAVWAVALLALALRYMERPRRWMLFAWAAIWALTFASKESAFFLVGMFGLLLLARSAPMLLEWVQRRRKLSDTGPAADLLIVMTTLTLPMWAPTVGLVQGLFGVILVNPDGNNPLVRSGELFRAATETGAPSEDMRVVAGIIVLGLAVVSVVVGCVWNWRWWPLLFGTFAAVWLPLFTSLFSNWNGFFTGLWGSLGYWIAQQGVERANQPWYYYIIGLSVYEFAIAVPALAGSIYLLAKRRNTFDYAIVGWAALSFIIYSIAGERMPWLLTGIAVPCAFVAGRAVGMLAEHAEASGYRLGVVIAGCAASAALAVALPFLVLQIVLGDGPLAPASLIAGGVSLALISALAAMFGAQAPQGAAPPLSGDAADGAPTPPTAERGNRAQRRRAAQRTSGGVSFGAASLTLSADAYRMIAAVLLIGTLAAALGMTIFFSARAVYSYEGFERPRELLVYSQTGQESPYAAECIGRIAQNAGLGQDGIRILSDQHDNVAWQWRWYLRDYPNVAYRSLDTQPLTAPPSEHVLLMSTGVYGSENANEEHLGGYTRLGELHTLWWFPNYAYAGITPVSVVEGAFSQSGWRTAVDYMLRRELASDMQTSRSVLYVQNGLSPYTEGCEAFLQVQTRYDEGAS